jgi:hypothetical protein
MVILMSKSEATTTVPNIDDEDRLDQLYELEDELKQIADSDTRYSTYAENALESLREAGYDV